ncbi:MAG: hypothetical protein AAGG69_02195 [Pseudomonadota bacterium]
MRNRQAGLGDRVKCKITGFTGIVTTHARHLAGCDRLWVVPPVGEDGKSIEGIWHDIDMVEIVEADVLSTVQFDRKTPGGVDLPATR